MNRLEPQPRWLAMISVTSIAIVVSFTFSMVIMLSVFGVRHLMSAEREPTESSVTRFMIVTAGTLHREITCNILSPRGRCFDLYGCDKDVHAVICATDIRVIKGD